MGGIGEAAMEKDEYWLWLGTIPGIGNVTALKLLNAFGGDIRVLYEADKKTIAGRHIVSEKQLQSIIYSRNRDRICRAYAQMKEKGIHCLSIVDTHYPDMSKHPSPGRVDDRTDRSQTMQQLRPTGQQDARTRYRCFRSDCCQWNGQGQ